MKIFLRLFRLCDYLGISYFERLLSQLVDFLETVEPMKYDVEKYKSSILKHKKDICKTFQNLRKTQKNVDLLAERSLKGPYPADLSPCRPPQILTSETG